MKINAFLLTAALLIASAAGGWPARAADPAIQSPRIQKIELDGQTIVVTVEVPPGVKKVTLESRTRLGSGTWVPRAIRRFDGQGGLATFRLAASAQLEVMRVRGDAAEPLPASFYTGQKTFGGPASATKSIGGPGYGALEGAPGANDSTTGGSNQDPTRQVVESDIWRLAGDTLYFFNQYRGLQVIDLSQPDAPVVKTTLPLPASGEQMYLVPGLTGADRVVLLARNGCGWGDGDDSQVLIIDPAPPAMPKVTSGPRIVASLTLPGTIVESRLVGTALYVATQSYRHVTLPPKTEGGEPIDQWEYGMVVSSFDLADPDAPQARDQLWFAGYGNVIQATDRFLFVVLYDDYYWWRSTVRLVDIAAPDGTMKTAGTIHPAGRVADKFKLNLAGDVFTVISEVPRWPDATLQASVLETFSLADAMNPQKLGQLAVGHGEGLYATRFDGDRAYIVTFLRIDPLWIIDLKDPAHPRVAGEVEIPGWSNYIHPLGDRLVTIGIQDTNDWRVAVSLFDVHDPAQPALLAKVPLGEGNSWSEANYDEKAFTVLPDAGLILVPYQGWGEDGYVSRVQLIDLGTDSLQVRGVIEHAFQPRRATVHGERILSVSGRELLSVNAADRDHPVVAADLELSWPVDRVLPVGDFLLELAGGRTWYNAPTPVVRVARASEPDIALTRVTLTEDLSLLGATVSDGVLYVVQGETGWLPVPEAKPGEPTPEPKARLLVSTFSLEALPELQPLGSYAAEVDPLNGAGEFQMLWPRPGILLLASQGGGYRWGWGLPVDAGIGGVRPGIWWPGWGGGSGRLIALDVSDPAAPKLASDLNLGTDGNWWSFSQAFTAEGLVLLSHQASEFVEGVTLPGQPPPEPYEIVKPDGSKETVTPPVGIWVTKYYLDAVDYADPTSPTVRPPVNLPGTLRGVAAGGALLFTTGPHWDEKWQTDWTEYVDACAYDNVQVSLVASLKQPTAWPHAVSVHDGIVFLARPDEAPSTGGTLEAWSLNQSGAFELRGKLTLATPANQLANVGTALLAQTSPDIVLVDAADPAAIKVVGSGAPGGCVWADLTSAAGSIEGGVWIPLSDYGLFSLSPVPTP